MTHLDAKGGRFGVVERGGMRTTTLGRTGLTVSRLCLGTGTTASDGRYAQQAAVPRDAYARLLARAYDLGMRFWDTSDDYGTYGHIRAGLAMVDRAQVALATKTHAAAAADARTSVLQSLRALGVDRVEVLLQHEVDSVADFHLRAPAREELHRLKAEGLIGAVGVSSHSIEVVELAAGHPEVEVILTNVNMAEIHMDAGLKDYLQALETAHRRGQGVVVMKTLGEGRLGDRVEEALAFNLSIPFVDSVVVGINSSRELEEIAALAERLDAVPPAALPADAFLPRTRVG